MKKEVKLVKKVKRLIKRLGCPRWLHHFGPKTYEFHEHLSPLLMKQFCKGMSYRRIVELFDLFGIHCPSKSALQYTAKRIPSWLWNKILEITSGNKHHIIALDGTGFSMTNPSYYFLRRIDGKIPKMYSKLSAAFDTKTKKFCAAKIRIIPRHDILDAKYLVSKTKLDILVADKAYDANWLHEYCSENNIQTHIPKRDYGKVKHIRNSARRKASRLFRPRTYNRRVMIEAGFHSIKTKSGASVNSKIASTIRAEIYGKLICHNLFSYLFRVLGQSRRYKNFYIFEYYFCSYEKRDSSYTVNFFSIIWMFKKSK